MYVGYCGLGRAVNQLGLATEEPIEVDLVASSIGSLTYNFCSALYKACQGDSGIREFESSGAKAKNSRDSAVPTTQAALTQRFRVYFPSLKSVVASRGGKFGPSSRRNVRSVSGHHLPAVAMVELTVVPAGAVP